MKNKVVLSLTFLAALLLTSCHVTTTPSDSSSNIPSSNPSSGPSSSGDSQGLSSSSGGTSDESQPSSSGDSQDSSTVAPPEGNLPLEQDELYYEVDFGNGVSNESTKWTKGKTYSWTFNNCEAHENVCFAIGAKMSDASHSDRTLFTNHNNASSSDSFESNASNDGTPRFTVKVNNIQQNLFTYTYGDAGLTTSAMNPFKIAGMFSIPAGNVSVTLTTHASAGYRLYLGGKARLYYPNTGGGQSGEDTDEKGVFVFNDEELNTPQEIHTTNQKAYLNFSKPYYQITKDDLDGFDAKGNKNVSTPEPVTINWKYGVPEGKTLSKYSLVFGQQSDLSDGFEVNGTTAKSLSFYNSFLGDNYFKVVAHFSDGSKQESPIKIFKVDTTCPRNLKVGNMPNCRDMGGRTTEAGGKIKQGLIYRTSGSKFDNSTASNAEAKKILLNQLKVKTEINVANSTTNNVNLTGVKVEDCFMAYGSVPYSNLARNSVRIRQIMDILADETNYPVFYHCRIGTDRTGITGVMIGGLLGIPFNEIIQDYGFSNFAPIDNQRYPHKEGDSNGDNIDKYIDEILALPGKNFQEQTYLALRMIGVPATKLDKIIDFMTIGNKATIPSSFKVGEGDNLVSSVSKTTATDYKTPGSYYAVSSGKSISYTASVDSGKKNVIVYMGYTGSISTSTTTLLSSAISLKIDGVAKAISNTKNLWQAGFGSTKQDSRIGYMFNILGEYDFTAGSHTVEITVNNNTFNIASITVA